MRGEPVFQEIMVHPEIKETPEEFLQAVHEESAISYRDLKEYISKLKENGIKINTELVSLHHKLAYPWYSLVVMFLSVPFLAKTSTRRLIALNVLICLVIVFTFHISGAITLALGKAGKLFPIMSAWTANFLFGFGTFFFLERANE